MKFESRPELVASDFGFDFNPFVMNYVDNEYTPQENLKATTRH